MKLQLKEGRREIGCLYLKLMTHLKTPDMVKNFLVLKMWDKKYCKGISQRTILRNAVNAEIPIL